MMMRAPFDLSDLKTARIAYLADVELGWLRVTRESMVNIRAERNDPQYATCRQSLLDQAMKCRENRARYLEAIQNA